MSSNAETKNFYEVVFEPEESGFSYSVYEINTFGNTKTLNKIFETHERFVSKEEALNSAKAYLEKN